MYGTQTHPAFFHRIHQFENDVKMYGTQTISPEYIHVVWFENDVKMYGTQTSSAFLQGYRYRLRMM